MKSISDDQGARVVENYRNHHTYTNDNLTRIEVGRVAAQAGQVTELVYNGENRLAEVRRRDGAGVLQTLVTNRYDSEGNRLRTTDAEGRATQFHYDALGRMVRVVDPALNETAFGYDAAGNRVSVTDARGNVTRQVYDGLNRLIRTEQLGVTPAAVTTYTYDAVGNLTTVTDPENNTTTYVYDTLSRQREVIQPLGQRVRYDYDARDRLTRTVNARDQRLDYAYHPWGGLARIDHYPDLTATTPARTLAYSYHPTGDLAGVTDSARPGWSQSYALDALNRVVEEHVAGTPLGQARLTHDYDRFGNRAALALERQVAGAWVQQYRYTYEHDGLNRLQAAGLISPQSFGFEYFADDALKTLTHPNGVVTEYAYEPSGPIRQIQVSGTNGIIEQFDYTYDQTLNVDTLALLTEGTHDYGYDALNRLTQALHPTGTGLDPAAYAYDGVGNRADANTPADWDYDGNNRIVQSPGLTYTFDADGNQVGRSDGAVFGYSADNRLISYTKGTTAASYAYDPFGRRIQKTVNGTTTWFLWDGERLLGEYDAAGNEIRRYAYLPGRYAPVEMADANGTYAIHTDHLDTPRRATNATQQVVWRAFYEAYGNAVVDEDPDGDGQALVVNVRFPGQYYDQETGFYYNYYRDYDPNTGRYLTSEPIGLLGVIDRSAAVGIDPVLNLYIYAGNNPINYFDPDGEFLVVLAWLSAVAIPAGITYIIVDCINDCKKQQSESCDNGISIVNECAQRCIPFLNFLGLNSPKNLAVTAGKKAGGAAGSD